MKPRFRAILKTGQSPVRARFFSRSFQILLSAIPVMILWNESGPLRWIGLASLVFGGYQLIRILMESQSIVDEFFPPKTAFDIQVSRLDTFINFFAMVVFFAGLFFLTYEVNNIENTLGGLRLFLMGSVVGIALAGLITITLKFFRPSVYYTSSRRYTVYFGLFIGLSLLVPAVASFINRTYCEDETRTSMHKITKQGVSSGRSKSYWIYLDTSYDSEERFKVSRDFYQQVLPGETIVLTGRKGRLGYDVVQSFKKQGE